MLGLGTCLLDPPGAHSGALSLPPPGPPHLKAGREGSSHSAASHRGPGAPTLEGLLLSLRGLRLEKHCPREGEHMSRHIGAQAGGAPHPSPGHPAASMPESSWEAVMGPPPRALPASSLPSSCLGCSCGRGGPWRVLAMVRGRGCSDAVTPHGQQTPLQRPLGTSTPTPRTPDAA